MSLIKDIVQKNLSDIKEYGQFVVDCFGVAGALNCALKKGYDVVNITPCHKCEDTLFVIVYRVFKEESQSDKNLEV